MPKLIIKKKAEVIREYGLKSAQNSLQIGSENNNDIVIEDKRISMNHVRVERQGNRYFIRDLNSAFGTYLNGQKIEGTCELHDGDLIQIGDHTILFDNPVENLDLGFTDSELSRSAQTENAAATESAANQARTDLATLEALEKELRKERQALRKPRPGQTESMAPYYLLAIYGPYVGKKFQLRYGETRIGRDKNLNDIVISQNSRGQTDQSISRRHATILYRDGYFYVADKRSKTRTYVNQVMVPEDEEVQLYPGDEIEIVSDQQSTIFRFVSEGNWNFSPPKKAGVWWVRYRSRFVYGLAALALTVGALLLFYGYNTRQMLTQKPAPLTLEMASWPEFPALHPRPGASQTEAGETELRGSPALADFNGDGYVDIATRNGQQQPVLVDGQSRTIAWTYETIASAPSCPLVAADINSNGLNDLIFLSQDRRIVTIDGKFGAEIWVSPFFESPLNAPPVVGDFNGDGLADIAVSDEAGTVHIGFNQQISMEWAAVLTSIPMRAPLSCADLDQDGDLEILCGTERGLVLIIDGNSRTVAGTIDINEELSRALGTYLEDNQIRFPVGVADLTGDGTADLAISTVQGNLVTIDGRTKEYLWYERLSEESSLSPEFTFPFAIADFSGDRVADIALATSSGEVRAYLGSGENRLPKMIWESDPGILQNTLPALAMIDLTKDGTPDLPLKSAANELLIVDGRTGQTVAKAPLPVTGGLGMPLGADFQKDGWLDILLVSGSGGLYQWQTNTRVPQASVFWGQRYGTGRNDLTLPYQMPPIARANLVLALGGLLCIGGGATSFVYRRRR